MPRENISITNATTRVSVEEITRMIRVIPAMGDVPEEATDAIDSASPTLRRWESVVADDPFTESPEPTANPFRDAAESMREVARAFGIPPTGNSGASRNPRNPVYFAPIGWDTVFPRASLQPPERADQFTYEGTNGESCVMRLSWADMDGYMNNIATPRDLVQFTRDLQDLRDRTNGFFEYEDFAGQMRVYRIGESPYGVNPPMNTEEFFRRIANLERNSQRGASATHPEYPVRRDGSDNYIEYRDSDGNREQLFFGVGYRLETYEDAVNEAMGLDPDFPPHQDGDRHYIEYRHSAGRTERAYYGAGETDPDYRTAVRLTRQYYENCGHATPELQFPSVNIHARHWGTCKKCKKRVLSRVLKNVADINNNYRWCTSCISEFAENVEGSIVTAEYFEANYAHCKECGFPRRLSSVKDSVCKPCREYFTAMGFYAPVLAYNAPVPHVMNMFSHPDIEGLNVGVEIELETRAEHKETLARAIRAIMGRDDMCIKHDGSLGDKETIDGFEIVTAANSVEYTRVVIKRLFENRKTALSEFKLVAWKSPRCGLHVHISRKPLTDLQIGKIVSFVHNPENRSMIMKIAGRDNERYGGWGKAKGFRKGQPSVAAEIAHTSIGDHHARYTGVNVSNPDTIEIRIFKGTLNKLRLFACIEFVHALTRFCAPCVANLQNSASHIHFLAWLQHEGRYPNLKQFLKNSDILEDE